MVAARRRVIRTPNAAAGRNISRAVDRPGDGHLTVAEQRRAERDRDGQHRVVDADLERAGHRLRALDPRQPRQVVADQQAEHAQRQGGRDHRQSVEHDVPVRHERGRDRKQQHHYGCDPHRQAQPSGQGGRQPPDQHPDRHRDQHDRDHLQHLVELQPDGPAPDEVAQRQIDHHRERHHGEHRVDRGQRDVQGDVTAEQVAEQVRRGAAGRGDQQHHPDRERAAKAEGQHEQEAEHRQQHDLAGQRDEHGLGVGEHPGEVGDGQREPEPQHHDAQGDREHHADEHVGHPAPHPPFTDQTSA